MTSHCSEHDKFYYKCKECCKAYHRLHYSKHKEEYKLKHAAWYQVNKEKHKDKTSVASRRRKYGMSNEDFLNLLEQQKGCCAICNHLLADSHKQCVDHCHTTGKVRGILCGKCNMALGLFQDSWEVLSSAMNYLERSL